MPVDEKIVVGKRRRKRLSSAPVSTPATATVAAHVDSNDRRASCSKEDNHRAAVSTDDEVTSVGAARLSQQNRTARRMQLSAPRQAAGGQRRDSDDLGDYARSASNFASVRGRSRIFKDDLTLAAVHALLPCYQQVNDWQLLYSNHTHGSSLATFSRLCAHKGPNLVVIEDTTGAIFGGYASTAWRAASGSDGAFFGTGQSFLWRMVCSKGLHSTAEAPSEGCGDSEHEAEAEVSVEQYSWTRVSQGQFMRIAEDSLAMGGRYVSYVRELSATVAADCLLCRCRMTAMRAVRSDSGSIIHSSTGPLATAIRSATRLWHSMVRRMARRTRRLALPLAR